MVSQVKDNIVYLYNEYPGNPDLMDLKPQIVFPILAVLTYLVSVGQYSPSSVENLILVVPLIGILSFVSSGLYVKESESLELKELSKMYNFLTVTLIALVLTYIIYTVGIQFTPFLQISILIGISNAILGLPFTAFLYYSLYILFDISRESLNILNSEVEET